MAELADAPGLGPGTSRCAGSSPVVPICFIGDLHGRLEVLNKIFKDAKRRGTYHFVLIGDILHHKRYFKRTKPVHPVVVLKAVKSLQEAGKVTVIMGNNEAYILDSIYKPFKEIKSDSVKQTVLSINKLKDPERQALLTWIANLPKYLELDSAGKKYRAAHAYYPSAKFNADSHVLSGPDYAWFKKDDLADHLDPGYQYILGHYGYPYMRDNLRIIDATLFEGVGAYYTDRNEFMLYY